MRRIAVAAISLLIRVFVLATGALARLGGMPVIGRTAKRLAGMGRRFRDHRSAAEELTRDVEASSCAQAKYRMDEDKRTVFLIISSGQAIRNFLLSDVYRLIAADYNLVILSPYAHSPEFVASYAREGVHVLPWFGKFELKFERLFSYYLMRMSGSGTHKRWLANLDERARRTGERRFLQHRSISRASNMLGAILGRRGIAALYQSYLMALSPAGLLRFLFDRYRPALVISTAAHQAEAWPLTAYGKASGATVLCNILSWDHTTIKPAIDPACDVCTVWSDDMAAEIARHHPHVAADIRLTGAPMFDMYYDRSLAVDRAAFLAEIGLPPERPYILYTTNTPGATSDEHAIIRQYWRALCRSPLAGKVSLLVRLHPKQELGDFADLVGLKDVAVTLAGKPVWGQADRWIPGQEDMGLLLNSLLHAAVSVNIASTMTLESFAVGLPTINVAFRPDMKIEERHLMWSFDMFHTSDHYRAIVDNGAVDLARSLDELVAMTVTALEHGGRRDAAMRKTLRQKVAYCDGTSARRFVEVVHGVLAPGGTVAHDAMPVVPDRSSPGPLTQAAE